MSGFCHRLIEDYQLSLSVHESLTMHTTALLRISFLTAFPLLSRRPRPVVKDMFTPHRQGGYMKQTI